MKRFGDYKALELPCPKCSSSDAYVINDNGWGHCFSCGSNVPPENGENEITNSTPTESPEVPRSFDPLPEVGRPFIERGLTKETIGRYKVTIPVDEDVAGFEAKYPIFSVRGEHVGNKVRRAGKKFLSEGNLRNTELGLFGQHTFEPGCAKAITVVEGQDDAMAVYQLTGSKYPCVSVHSASTAHRDIQWNFEYLNSFQSIVICMDNDSAGKRAVKEILSLPFPLGKVRVLTLQRHKDPSDYLLASEGQHFLREWWQAPVYKPDELKMGVELWDAIQKREQKFTVLYPWEGLNTLTYGLRLSELVTITADTGVGKTSVLKTIEHKLLTEPDVIEKGYGVGFLHLEEPIGDTALGLLSIHNGVPYHLPDVERNEEELKNAFETVLNHNRAVMWDSFGSNEIETVLDKIRYMAASGCKYIVLDHLSIIVSDQSGDERKQLDEITTKIKTLTVELDICVICVIHTNRQGQIRGTAGVEQLSNIVIRLVRDKTDANEWRRNVTEVIVEKNRFCGYTGPASWLWYNKHTGRLQELNEEQINVFTSGGAIIGDEMEFGEVA